MLAVTIHADLDEDLPDSVDDNDNSDNDDYNDDVGIDEDNNDDDEAGEYVNTSRLARPQVACSTRQKFSLNRHSNCEMYELAVKLYHV